jgi:hypothetical protein
MPNTLATPVWTLKETTRLYTNELTFLANVNKSYDDQYIQAGAKVGNTVNARLPQRFQVTDGQALQTQAIYDQTVPITLTNQKNVAFGYSTQQATTELDSIRQRYCQPGAEALANAAEVLAFNAVYRDIYSSVGTPGTTPSATLTCGAPQPPTSPAAVRCSRPCWLPRHRVPSPAFWAAWAIWAPSTPSMTWR